MGATNRGEVVVGNMVSDDEQRRTVAVEWASSTYLGCARWRCGTAVERGDGVAKWRRCLHKCDKA
ncbi:UNVERIFIED_CONTAM: hypothetical protein Sradi_5865300 [Sesamum radiatum]|uniref:Uncharacterized protein n=1 Tax=Sesamum radiatum TaxID=300843 RepID=A0AAW2KQJ2_SESRA